MFCAEVVAIASRVLWVALPRCGNMTEKQISSLKEAQGLDYFYVQKYLVLPASFSKCQEMALIYFIVFK